MTPFFLSNDRLEFFFCFGMISKYCVLVAVEILGLIKKVSLFQERIRERKRRFRRRKKNY